jgi:hypothetical protein
MGLPLQAAEGARMELEAQCKALKDKTVALLRRVQATPNPWTLN